MKIVKLKLAYANRFSGVDFRDSPHKKALDYAESLCAKYDGKKPVYPKKCKSHPITPLDIVWEDLKSDVITVKVRVDIIKAVKVFGQYLANETIFGNYEVSNHLLEII